MTLGDACTDMLGKKEREKVMLWCQFWWGLCRREGACPSYPESMTGPQGATGQHPEYSGTGRREMSREEGRRSGKQIFKCSLLNKQGKLLDKTPTHVTVSAEELKITSQIEQPQ